LCTYIQLFLWPPKFSLWDKFIPKIAIFRDFGINLPQTGKFIPKITNFGEFGVCKPTFLKPHLWSLAWGYGPGTPSPAPNFVKIIQGDLSLRGNFFEILSYISPHFYTHNVEILLKRMDLESINDTKCHHHHSRGLPVLHCLGGDAYWYLVCFAFKPTMKMYTI